MIVTDTVTPTSSSGAAPRRTLRKRITAHPVHGPLPALLLGLTVLTGLVDAVSILALGRVFVANMTGNVVFVGFALAGAAGFALRASVAGLVGFLVGAGAGGQLSRRLGDDRGVLIATGTGVELVLVTAALFLVAASSSPLPAGLRAVTVGVLAVGTGVQNAVVRRLAVPDMTTTVLTMTLTGITADLRGGKPSPALTRRLVTVAAMLVGAVTGAGLVLHEGAAAALTLATVLLGVVTFAAAHTTRRPATWRSGSPPSPMPPPTRTRTSRRPTGCGMSSSVDRTRW